jgi:hypothetical protein
VKGRNKRSEKTLHNRQIVGDRRCCPERQMLLCSVCCHTLAQGFWPWCGRAIRHGGGPATDAGLDTVAASVAWARRGSTRQMCPSARHRTRLMLRHIYMVLGLCPSWQQTCGLRASDTSDGGMVASVGRDRRVKVLCLVLVISDNA